MFVYSAEFRFKLLHIAFRFFAFVLFKLDHLERLGRFLPCDFVPNISNFA